MKSKAIRDSAKWERCTLQIVGICGGDPESTVLAHLPDESHGIAKKSDDISSCYACYRCHMSIDGTRLADVSEDDYLDYINHREWYMRRAMVRTWRCLIEKGLVVIK